MSHNLEPSRAYTCLVPGNQIEREAILKLHQTGKLDQAHTWREQVGITCSYLRNEKVRISYNRIGKMWGNANDNSIKEQETKFKLGVRPNGRPISLTITELNDIHTFIISTMQDHYPSYSEINEYVFQNIKKTIKLDTLRHLLMNIYESEFKTVPAIPIEKKRYEAEPAEIDTYFEKLETALKNVHPYFVYNLDEVGEQDFNDASEIDVIVPINYDKAVAYYPVDHSTKRITALSCITTSGDWIPPLIITSRTTIDSEINSILSPDKYIVAHQSNGFMTNELFTHWFSSIFIPELALKRQKYGYQGPILLICDQFGAHKNIETQFDLRQLGIELLFLVPHTSDQTQALDLGIFANQKQKQSNIRKVKYVSSQTDQICRIIKSLWMASNPIDVASAFRAAGIVMKSYINFQGITSVYLSCERGAATSVRHYADSIISHAETSGQVSQAQLKAKTKFDFESIHNNSFRIKL